MNWLQRTAQHERGWSFTLMGNHLVWTHGYHQSLFQYEYGFPANIAYALRYYFPRGAAVLHSSGYTVEASPELRPYAMEIADHVGISPFYIQFDNQHYELITDPTYLVDTIVKYLEFEPEFFDKIRSFLQVHLPHVAKDLDGRVRRSA